MHPRGPEEEIAKLSGEWAEEHDLPILLHQLPPLHLHRRRSATGVQAATEAGRPEGFTRQEIQDRG